MNPVENFGSSPESLRQFEITLQSGLQSALTHGDVNPLQQLITLIAAAAKTNFGITDSTQVRRHLVERFTEGATLCFQVNQVDLGLNLLSAAVELDLTCFAKDLIETISRHHFANGRCDEAISLLERFLKRSPGEQETQRLYFELLTNDAVSGGDYAKVGGWIDQLSNAIEAQSKINNAAHVSLKLGWKSSRLRDDIQLLSRDFFIPSAPSAEFYDEFLLASVLFQKGQLGKAKVILAKIVAHSPKQSGALLNLSLIHTLKARLTLQESEWQSALHLMQATVESSPNWALAHYALGRLMIEGFGNWEGALIALTKAIALDSTDERAFREAGEAQSRLTGFAGACEYYYEQYLALREARQNSHPIGKLGVRFLNWNNTYAFGHLLALPEMYRKMQLLNWIPQYNTILCADPAEIANHTLFDLWGQHFNIVSKRDEIDALRPLIHELTFDTSVVKIPELGVKRYQVAFSAVHKAWKAKARPKFFEIPGSIKQRGEESLARLGLPKGAWFVCVHMREAGFKQEGQAQFYAPRMVQPESYYPALRRLVAAGGYVIRLGEPSMTPLPSEPGFIDYARSTEKSDWMDLFLMSSCRFYLASATGSYGAGRLFEVPTLFTNWPILHALPEGVDDLFIYKLLRKKDSQQLLSIRETFAHPLFASEEIGKVEQHGHEFVDNTAEEIEAAVMEMLARTDPANRIHSELPKSEQQRLFTALYPEKAGQVSFSVCESFLEKHRTLLQ